MSHNLIRIRKLRDHIENLPEERFEMSTWTSLEAPDDKMGQMIHDCGTCACIGGWTEALFDPERALVENSISEVGALLGLEPAEASELFTPEPHSLWSHITQDDAVVTLNKLIQTGRVDWSHVRDR